MSNFWRDYFSEYGPSEAKSEEDLFKQVGLTINKQRIANDLFVRIVENMATQLELSRQDHLVDFCCGNGLLSYELAAHVAEVTAIDFTARNIQTAQSQKSRPNITYLVGDVTAPLTGFIGADASPTKFVMHGSLGYFTPDQLDTLLKNISQQTKTKDFKFLIASIPNVDLKWNFYNTPERRARYQENQEKDSLEINDGIGRWWSSGEIANACRQHDLIATIKNQPLEISNYRMDALITPAHSS